SAARERIGADDDCHRHYDHHDRRHQRTPTTSPRPAVGPFLRMHAVAGRPRGDRAHGLPSVWVLKLPPPLPAPGMSFRHDLSADWNNAEFGSRSLSGPAWICRPPVLLGSG